MLDTAKKRLWTYLHPDQHPRAVYVGDNRLLVKSRYGPVLVSSRDLSLMPFLALHGTFEDELARWLNATLRKGDVFVDVGANIGWFTMIGAKAVGPTGHVVALEADPRNYELLLDNLSINYVTRSTTALNVAAWCRRETLSFHQSTKFRGNGSLGEPDEEYRRRYPGDQPVLIEVAGVRLDDVLSDLPRVDVLKMDIEGAEADALEGLERTLAAGRIRAIVLEINPPTAQASWLRLAAWLEGRARDGWFATDLASGAALDLATLAAGRGEYANVVIRAPALED